MNATPDQAPTASGTAYKLGELAHHTIDYARAWSDLFACEAELARISANRLLFATVWVCFFVFGIVVSGNALVAVALNRWLQGWTSALALTLLLNFAVLFGLLLAMRGWWRRLSLPRSRRALRELMQRIHEADRSSTQ
jgi:H+/Cl- antiporter ClcA